MAGRTAARGRFAEQGAPIINCKDSLSISNVQPQLQRVRWLRETYGINGTKVLVDAAPGPLCDPSHDLLPGRVTPAIVDTQLAPLPLEDYTNTGRLHVNDAGALALSQEIATQILQTEKGAH